ncbi:MAG TPA: hypothetical protein VKS03_09735 [Thermoanaerobaculia bacterium]|nr:hypothetical protein [Thermoanaerobaculia bacterium]
MKRVVAGAAMLLLATLTFAQRIDETNGKHTQLYPTKDHVKGWAKPGGSGGQNIVYWGGPVIQSAKSVAIFWGPSWADGQGNLNATASEMLGFFAQFGTTGEYKVITQYSGIQQTNLTNTFWWDSSAPPTNVTDAALEAEVVKYFNQGGVADESTVYSVFLPPGSYSSYGSSTSCGGPNLRYCAYHSNFSYSGKDIKYASLPNPSCGGCQWTGFTVAQNLEHFACHETREAVTDPDGNAWFDRRGYEADDKCAWSPAPFIGTGGYGYQWEWSNAASGCVKTAP